MKIFATTTLFFVICTFGFGQQSTNSKDSITNYINIHRDSLNPIEGFWEINTTQEYYHFDTLYNVIKFTDNSLVALLEKEGVYKSFNVSGEPYDVEFKPTDVKSVYLYRNHFNLISEYSKSQAVISKAGEMEYTYDLPMEYIKIKLGDTYNKGARIVNILKWKKKLPSK